MNHKVHLPARGRSRLFISADFKVMGLPESSLSIVVRSVCKSRSLLVLSAFIHQLSILINQMKLQINLDIVSKLENTEDVLSNLWGILDSNRGQAIIL